MSVKGNLSANQSGPAVEACALGLGVGAFFAYQVAPWLTNGSLRVILSSFEAPPHPIHIVYPEARLLPARTRLFVDFIKGHLLREQRSWEPADDKRRAPKVPRAKTGARRSTPSRTP